MTLTITEASLALSALIQASIPDAGGHSRYNIENINDQSVTRARHAVATDYLARFIVKEVLEEKGNEGKSAFFRHPNPLVHKQCVEYQGHPTSGCICDCHKEA